MKWWFRRPLYLQIFVGILAGVGLGLWLGPRAVHIKFLGDIFLRLLMMLMVPLTFFTLTSGLTKLENLRSLRTLGGMTLLYYAASSLVAAALGMAVALLLQPGKNAAGLLYGAGQAGAETFSFREALISWFPQNPFQALAQGNMLQVIILSLILGVGLLAMGPRADRLVRLVNDAADLMIVVTEFVIKTAPYGIMALVANMVANLEVKMLAEVGLFLLADTASMLLLLALIYPLILSLLAKAGPLRFYRQSAPAILVAGSTTSSGAALPVAMSVADKAMGLPEKIWGFTLPLGATINQNGMAAAIGVIGVFAANLYGFKITPALLVQFVFLGLVLSAGTAGVKGSGVVISGILLQTLNMPLALIPLLASLWPVIDIGHTICNVTGDLVGTVLVASRLRSDTGKSQTAGPAANS